MISLRKFFYNDGSGFMSKLKPLFNTTWDFYKVCQQIEYYVLSLSTKHVLLLSLHKNASEGIY